MRYSTYVESELKRCMAMVRKDGRQRWVTMDGHIHDSPVPFKDAISVYVTMGAVVCTYRDRAPISPAIGCV